MLFNTVRLKPGVTFDDVELAVGELCSVVKDTYGRDKRASSPDSCSNFPASFQTKAPSASRGTPSNITPS